MPVVHKDLMLSEEQIKQVREAAAKSEETRAKLRDETEGKLTRDLRERLMQLDAQDEATIAKILNPAQATRLKQIVLQHLGPAGFTNPDITAALGLTKEQVDAMWEIWDKFRESSRKAKNTKEYIELQNERDKKLLEALRPEQKKKWAELTGPVLPLRGK
jgi:hypothetical protein